MNDFDIFNKIQKMINDVNSPSSLEITLNYIRAFVRYLFLNKSSNIEFFISSLSEFGFGAVAYLEHQRLIDKFKKS